MSHRHMCIEQANAVQPCWSVETVDSEIAGLARHRLHRACEVDLPLIPKEARHLVDRQVFEASKGCSRLGLPFCRVRMRQPIDIDDRVSSLAYTLRERFDAATEARV